MKNWQGRYDYGDDERDEVLASARRVNETRGDICRLIVEDLAERDVTVSPCFVRATLVAERLNTRGRRRLAFTGRIRAPKRKAVP